MLEFLGNLKKKKRNGKKKKPFFCHFFKRFSLRRLQSTDCLPHREERLIGSPVFHRSLLPSRPNAKKKKEKKILIVSFTHTKPIKLSFEEDRRHLIRLLKTSTVPPVKCLEGSFLTTFRVDRAAGPTVPLTLMQAKSDCAAYCKEPACSKYYESP